MGQFIRERIRIAFDVESLKPQTDEVVGESPSMWRGNAVQFELGFFFNGEPIDATAYQSIKLFVKGLDNRVGSPILMAKTVGPEAITPIISEEEWTSGEKQHCVIYFSGNETRLDMKGATEANFWLAVKAMTAAGEPITLGSTILKLVDDGEDDSGISVPLGSSLVPNGATYNGSGQYVLSGLTAGRHYAYGKNSNDTKLVNGTEELTASGNFVAAGTTATLIGTPSAVVTATIRYPVYLTLEEMDARYPRKTAPWALSPNGKKARIFGVNDDGTPYDQVVDI